MITPLLTCPDCMVEFPAPWTHTEDSVMEVRGDFVTCPKGHKNAYSYTWPPR